MQTWPAAFYFARKYVVVYYVITIEIHVDLQIFNGLLARLDRPSMMYNKVRSR